MPLSSTNRATMMGFLRLMVHKQLVVRSNLCDRWKKALFVGSDVHKLMLFIIIKKIL